MFLKIQKMKSAKVNKQTNEQTKADRRYEQNPLQTWWMARLPIGDTEDKKLCAFTGIVLVIL